MIRSINFLGKSETPGAVSNVAAPKPQVKAEAPAPKAAEPAKDTFVPSAPKAEEAPKADPNDKFEKKEEKPAEAK